MEDPFKPPSQPNRRWRYPGQNFGLIQQNREEVNWKIRTQSWVNDVPTSEECIDRLVTSKRKALEDLPNSKDVGSKKQKVSKTNHSGLVRRTTRMQMQLRSAVQKKPDENVDDAGQDDAGSGRQVQRGQSGRRGGRPAASKAMPATPVLDQAEGRTESGMGEEQPVVDSDNALDKLACISLKSTKARFMGSGLSRNTERLQPATLAQPPSSPSKRTTSPSKKSSQSGTQSTKVIDLLAYEPAIEFTTYEEEKEDGRITKDVRDLWLNFILPTRNTPPIPSQIRKKTASLFDTPENSRNPPPASSYAFQADLNKDQLLIISNTVEYVWQLANFWGRRDIHESTWIDLLVSQLLHVPSRIILLEEGGNRKGVIDVLDVRNVAVDPSSLCPDSEKFEAYKLLERKVDYVVGLRLSRHDLGKLGGGMYEVKPSKINQTSAFTALTPIFMNVEIKKQHSAVDPRIQLAVWIAAEFKKRVLEGWERSMPVIAVTVDGHAWELYIVYEPDFRSTEIDRLVFVGPIRMGFTDDLAGIWSIVRYLIAITRWGRTAYQDWFRSEILSRF